MVRVMGSGARGLGLGLAAAAAAATDMEMEEALSYSESVCDFRGWSRLKLVKFKTTETSSSYKSLDHSTVHTRC